jgi:hypothetical protein
VVLAGLESFIATEPEAFTPAAGLVAAIGRSERASDQSAIDLRSS